MMPIVFFIFSYFQFALEKKIWLVSQEFADGDVRGLETTASLNATTKKPLWTWCFRITNPCKPQCNIASIIFALFYFSFHTHQLYLSGSIGLIQSALHSVLSLCFTLMFHGMLWDHIMLLHLSFFSPVLLSPCLVTSVALTPTTDNGQSLFFTFFLTVSIAVFNQISISSTSTNW